MENHFQTAPFIEMVATNSYGADTTGFDIITDKKLTLQLYCNLLIEKIVAFPPTVYPSFLNHHTKPLKDPLQWLDNLEDLISSNENYFIDNKALCKYNKLFNAIEKKKEQLQLCTIKIAIAKKYINAESEERYFSFYEIKKQIENLDDSEKILVLTKAKHEYRQSNIEFINQKLPLFDVQCSKEIKQINEIENINKNRPNIKNDVPIIATSKLQFNCNVNQFVDVFYQMSRELVFDGKPMLEANINDIAQMIVNNFIDKDGREISPLSVKTILQPSREDKRPNTHKRIQINRQS